MASMRCDFDYNLLTSIATLHIKNTNLTDLATYTVVAENIAGKADTACKLTIDAVPNIDETPYVNPEIFHKLEAGPRRPILNEDTLTKAPFLSVKELKDQVCNEGDTVSFICEVKGYPKPEV